MLHDSSGNSKTGTWSRCGIAAAAAIAVAMSATNAPSLQARSDADVRVVASGLNDPRGLTFGPRGDLYIAEAGTGGGTLSTAGQCDQVQPPVGPSVGGASGRITKVSPNGAVTVVASGLPSSEASPLIGGDKEGIADVAIVDNQLMALLVGAGCSHGHADANNGILSVDRSGVSLVADLSAWLLANPGAKGAEQPRNPDYEPDGTWFSMLVQENNIYAVEPNHGLLVSVNKHDNSVALVRDLFATFGDHTYTALAADREDIYVGTLGRIAFGPDGPPVPDFVHSFEAGIYKVPRHGAPTQVASGLHAVLGIAFDNQHRLYALQSPIFIPGTGSLVRVNPDGGIETILSGLVFPSALRRGPDHAFYLSECSYHCGPGDGRVLRVVVE
jgi:hypothetical protein